MAGVGLVGARRGVVKRTTIADPGAERASDLVLRNFRPLAPDRLWVADITYVSTWSGWVYVAFVVDAYARRILGCRAGSTMSTQLVLDALEQAIWTRQRACADLTSVVAHSDRGSQYTAIRYSERLEQAGIAGSVGSVGDSFDHALAETINGLFKTELIEPQRTLADPGTGRVRHRRVGRLVQPQPALRVLRRHSTGTARGSLLRSPHSPAAGRADRLTQSPDTPGWFNPVKARILELLPVLGLEWLDSTGFAVLRKIRGQLLRRPKTGPVEVVAGGRDDWIGWVDLVKAATDAQAMAHTAMVMRDIGADILGVVAAENRPALDMFSAPPRRRRDTVRAVDGDRRKRHPRHRRRCHGHRAVPAGHQVPRLRPGRPRNGLLQPRARPAAAGHRPGGHQHPPRVRLAARARAPTAAGT